MSAARTLKLFEGHGLEIELMLVDPVTLDVVPAADRVLAHEAGEWATDVVDGDMGWSNELVLHVLEVKNERPVGSLAGLELEFRRTQARLAAVTRKLGLLLLPGAVHPWMDPTRETRIWPHDYAEVYGTYHRLFDCHRHGWANLQSTHLNLSFGDDREFARLHAAVRMVLPLIPALAASSPVMEGKCTGLLDSRVVTYRDNSRRLPSMTGRVIPEPSKSPAHYRATVLEPLWRDLLEIEPEGTLQHEFANARGAIPRFERDAIEVRLIDAQECPRADVAVSALVTEAVRMLVEQRHLSFEQQYAWPTEALVSLLDATCRTGPSTALQDPALARAFGCDGPAADAGAIWRAVAGASPGLHPDHAASASLLLEQGTLAQRLLARLPAELTREDLRGVWRQLATCLEQDRLLGELPR